MISRISLLVSSFSNSDIDAKCKKLLGAQVDGQPSNARDCFTKASFRLILTIISATNEKYEASVIGMEE